MKQRKAATINPKDLYQLLIAECRYGYSRKNHLMPWGAFEHCRQYLPELYKADKDMALHTAKQLAEEAIGELQEDASQEKKRRFSIVICSGKEASAEIESKFDLLQDYNIWHKIVIDSDLKVSLREADGKENSILCSFYKAQSGSIQVHASDNSRYSIKLYFAKDVEKGEAYDVPFRFLGFEGFNEGTEVYLSISRLDRVGQVKVNEYIEFIDYCLNFIKVHASNDAPWLNVPYNITDYIRYKNEHNVK